MDNNILELNGLSIEILEQLSYESKLGISLKKNFALFCQRGFNKRIGGYGRMV